MVGGVRDDHNQVAPSGERLAAVPISSFWSYHRSPGCLSNAVDGADQAHDLAGDRHGGGHGAFEEVSRLLQTLAE